MIEIINKDYNCLVAIHPIMSEEQCNNQNNINSVPIICVKSVKRKCEWVTTHKVLHEMLREPTTYTYDSKGKPILNNRTEKVSISHSKNYSAVIVSPEKRVGIDIEELGHKIFKISNRFVNPPEQKFIDNNIKKIELIYIVWCAKEALYKLSEICLDFKKHIYIEDFTLGKVGTFNAKIIHPECIKQYILNYRLTEKFVLVWVVDENINVK